MASSAERMRILEMIERGEIGALDGLRLLEDLPEALTPGDAAPGLVDEAAAGEKRVLKGSPAGQELPWRPEMETAWQDGAPRLASTGAQKWRRWQKLPLWAGLGLTLLTLVGMAAIFTTVGIGLLFLCTWIPFLLGLLLLGLGWLAHDAPWLQLRIQQKPGEKPQRIAFSFPLPVRPLAWLVRNFGHLIPALQETSLDEILLSLDGTTSPDNPIYLQVDDGEDGEKVEIFIG